VHCSATSLHNSSALQGCRTSADTSVAFGADSSAASGADSSVASAPATLTAAEDYPAFFNSAGDSRATVLAAVSTSGITQSDAAVSTSTASTLAGSRLQKWLNMDATSAASTHTHSNRLPSSSASGSAPAASDVLDMALEQLVQVSKHGNCRLSCNNYISSKHSLSMCFSTVPLPWQARSWYQGCLRPG